jgi:hypothetical protein
MSILSDIGDRAKNATPKDRAEGAAAGLKGLTESGDSGSHMQSFKKGGKVKKTGLAKLHEGERVLTRKQAKKYGQKKGRGKG